MAMLEGKMVAILFVVTHPSTGKLNAVLSRRGGFNPETVTNMEKLGQGSFPGICQLTAGDRTKMGEPPALAIWRMIQEKLGSSIYYLLKGVNFTLMETEGRHIAIRYINWKDLGLLPHGHFVLVDKDAAVKIEVADDAHEREGYPDMTKVAMFDPERNVVFRALFKPLE